MRIGENRIGLGERIGVEAKGGQQEQETTPKAEVVKLNSKRPGAKEVGSKIMDIGGELNAFSMGLEGTTEDQLPDRFDELAEIIQGLVFDESLSPNNIAASGIDHKTLANTMKEKLGEMEKLAGEGSKIAESVDVWKGVVDTWVGNIEKSKQLQKAA